MKYIVRVIKYFIYITLIMAAILAVMVALKVVEGDISSIFRDGYNSLWKIALMFLAVSAFYPKFGFCKRGAIIPGEYGSIRKGVIDYMESHGYVLESEEGENITFRKGGVFQKIRRMFEDRITMTRDLPGFYVEGLTKDVVRIVSGLEYKFRSGE